MSTQTNEMFKSTVLGHPSGLFVLFFTEMWERFSYYGMRALLVMFLTASLTDSGWGWPKDQAYVLFGTYTALVYLSTMLGGYFADNVWGYRKAVVVGAILMTLGHGAMALETTWSIYLGLTLLVFGSGFFKPNMTSIISHMYKDHQEKKDGAYTIFYMGVNAGAFLGILLCGYLGETVGWSIGFGLAGIFMFFGCLQFWFSRDIFGDIGLKPKNLDKSNAADVAAAAEAKLQSDDPTGADSLPFSSWQKALIGVSVVLGLVWIINDPASKIYGYNVLDFKVFGMDGSLFTIIFALACFVFLLVYRLGKYGQITRDKMIAVTFFAFLTIFFWAIFEQAPGSLTTFARDFTDRSLDGGAALTYKIVNSLMTLIPLGIITWVLGLLFKQTFKKYSLANIILGFSFVIIWGVAIWMLYTEFQKGATEVPASWFGVLNSLFIIGMAPLFSKWWESKYNPSANGKFAIGMTLLGIGMACVAFGGSSIEAGATTASVSMFWLVLVYFFHTMGELCTSPVGLSYVSKLVPGKMIAFMFGIWYLAVAIGMKTAGIFGESSEAIAKEEGISYFFWLLTIVAVVLALFSLVMGPTIKKLMHGVR
ncbi:MAG: peptide MFS transporter [Flavobacteriaceae bacterium]|jgi:proton-dependent oligopeptide transporter, POT family